MLMLIQLHIVSVLIIKRVINTMPGHAPKEKAKRKSGHKVKITKSPVKRMPSKIKKSKK